MRQLMLMTSCNAILLDTVYNADQLAAAIQLWQDAGYTVRTVKPAAH